MITVYLDVPVGRRTVLTTAYDENWEPLKTEKTARAIFDWLVDEGHTECRMWSNDHLFWIRVAPGQPYENPFQLKEAKLRDVDE